MAKKRTCPAESTVELIGGRWKIVILWYLFRGVKRFSELQRALTGITHWHIALYKLVNDYPSAVVDAFNSDQLAYYALSLNGILSGLVGLFVWSRLPASKLLG